VDGLQKRLASSVGDAASRISTGWQLQAEN
jgi:hypothetical protein